MKIVNLITQMEAGGAQGAAVRNARHQRAQGYDAEVWFLYRKRGVYDREPFVKYFLSGSPSSVWDALIVFYRLFVELRRQDKSSCALICYTHYANVIGGIVGRVAGVRKIVASHRNPVHTYPSLCRRLDLLAGFLGFYNSIIAVSNTVLNSFSGYPLRYKRRIKLIVNGIDPDDFSCSKDDAPEYIKELFKDEFFYLCTTGRYHKQKNHQIVLEAMKDLEGFRLILAGDGELHDEYAYFIRNNGIEDRVILLGEIPPEDVKYLLAYSDVFVFPSHYEAFGFSVVEAMAAKLPVLCSDIPAMQEIVGDSGKLLNNLKPQEWVSAIKDLSGHSELLCEYSRRSYKRSKNFSLNRMAECYIDECK